MGPSRHEVKYRVSEEYRRLGVHGVQFYIQARTFDGTPQEILSALGEDVQSETAARERLLCLIEERTDNISEIPDTALVSMKHEPCDSECADLLTVVTVITKSSSSVFIKSKRPLLSRLREIRRVLLLLPNAKEN